MEPVKDHQGMKIIGIDNGYGNIKTANCCFPAGLTVHGAEPVFKDDLLVYDGRYYLIGTGHKEFKADKTGDDDYYILTLAAIARELNVYGLTDATVYLAVGLPLTWVSRQREDFKAYLMPPWLSASTFRTTPASTRSASTWTMTRWAGTRQRVSWLAWGTDTKCWTGRRPAARM